ncbi:MAG: M20/M25/M40 family metallo-hydrolase [Ruminococcaceae bacterium]|nr:M20/M25/M40 family metallo-hydrolase [Oscillospiraceae bacterium]
MSDSRTNFYAQRLSRLIQAETVSIDNQTDKTKFYKLQEILREMFPNIFSLCDYEDFDGSFLMRWKGVDSSEPVMLMNHHDVVEAPGKWKHPAFSGEISENKIWGRGTLDNKGGLWAMLQAADELAADGFVPKHDIFFVSTCNEETSGSGADSISNELLKRNIHFSMVLDEGGMIVDEPIANAKGLFAMVGLGEKGCADIKFIARSSGGHASAPQKNSPLVRLGKFMAAVEKINIFKAELSPTVCAMFKAVSSSMKGPVKLFLGHPRLFGFLLVKAIPIISSTAAAMLKTTIAFTMACGSEGTNVMPQEAYVIGNMRYSHHQGKKASIEAITKLAKKFDIETVILSDGFSSPMSDYNSKAFKLIEKAINEIYPNVKVSPYLPTGASDSRFMSRVCENCLRFSPFIIDNEQLKSVHAINENVNISSLSTAVDFYRHIMQEA